jgi:CRISPR system Cascade subunit CasD
VRSVLLRLCGPLQSWGTQGRFSIRDTDAEPSKSGVLGLVGAALGMPRDDDTTLAKLRGLRLAVRVDREGALVRDFHTVGGGRFLGEPHGLWSAEDERTETKTALTQRYYLADASFLVALGGQDVTLVDRVAAALQAPVWPLFLGRRACPPSEPVFAGVFEGAPEEAIVSHPLALRDRSEAPERIRLVLETNEDGGRPRQDEPETFRLYGRSHRLRYVRYEFIDRDRLPEPPP